MAALRAYSNTITLDGFLLHSHILCRSQERPQALTNAWRDDGIRRGREGMLGSFSRPSVPSSFSSHPITTLYSAVTEEVCLLTCSRMCLFPLLVNEMLTMCFDIQLCED